MSLPATLRLPATAFLIALGFVGGIAGAAPVSLDCRASGPAGTVAFRLIFDEAAKQASTVWSAGGGRPHAQWFGDSGTDNAIDPIFNATSISAGFQYAAFDDPAVYRVNVDRTNGSVRFIRYNPVRMSEGSCGASAAPPRLF